MEISGEQIINAPQEKVWNALNDPEILKECIPGCKELNVTEETEGFEAAVQAKVGPVKATFKGQVRLENINAPHSYTITGEGKGGAAGFAKGSADVRLSETDGKTHLSYKVDAKIGGKLAQIGSRLIDSTAKKMSSDFFEKFSALVAPPQEDQKEGQAPQKTVEAPVTEQSKKEATQIKKTDIASEQYVPIMGIHPLFWTVGLVTIMVGLIFSFSG